MKKLIIGVLIYVFGVVCAYHIGKTSMKDHNKRIGVKDKAQDRVFISVISLGSWATVVAIPLADFLMAVDEQREIQW